MVIGTLRLDQVDYVEFVGGVLPSIVDFEIEPLGICSGIVVILEN